MDIILSLAPQTRQAALVGGLRDTVNLASRIESANKLYGTHVLMCGEMALDAGALARLRLVDRVRVLGRQEPVELWEPVPAGLDAGMFDRAFSLWTSGQFVEALVDFEALAANDPVSARFVSRCRAYIGNVPRGWDGVTTLDGK